MKPGASRPARWAPWLLALVLATAPAVAAETDRPTGAGKADPFPPLETLRGNVGFWIHVFSEWRADQVAVHDLGYPAVVFEVVDLPGPAEERYTDEQKEHIEKVRQRWSDWLLQVERKIEEREPLDEVEARWVLHFATVAGGKAIEGAHGRVRTQRGLRERFRAGLGRATRHEAKIREIFREAGLPEDLVYLPHVESSFETRARSSAGASGLWQFTRDTGRRYLTISPAIDERLDPIRATRAAADYLRDAYQELGTWPLALTSYNHGVAGMLRAKQSLGDDFERIYREYDGRSFGFASKNFYAEFLAAREVASRPEHYFPEGIETEPPFDHERLRLDRRTTVPTLASRYGVSVTDLAAINPGWTSRALSGGSSLPEGTEVWLPAGTLARAAGSGAGGGDRPEQWTDPQAKIHVVRRGDTLFEIARAAGIPVATLRRLNDIPADGNLIHQGQRLRLEAAQPATAEGEATRRHVVRRGDTLLLIAGTHGVTLVDLLEANRLRIDSVIRPGQVLHIPGH